MSNCSAKQHTVEDTLDKMIRDVTVPHADKLLLVFLVEGFEFRGQSREFDQAAKAALRHLSDRYPDIAALAADEGVSANDATGTAH